MSPWQAPHNASSKSPHLREAKEEYSKRRPLSGYRVLVVEDEFIVALELQSNLEEAGAVIVGPASTLEAALDLAKRGDISVATLDLRLARDSVAPVAHILEERGIPFIFYSGQPATDPIFLEWPRHRSLTKPADASELVDALTDIAGLPH